MFSAPTQPIDCDASAFLLKNGRLTESAANAYENTAFDNLDSFVYAFIENVATDGSIFTPILSKLQPQLGYDAVEHSVVLPLAEKFQKRHPKAFNIVTIALFSAFVLDIVLSLSIKYVGK